MNESELTGTKSAIEELATAIAEKLMARFDWLERAHPITQTLTKEKNKREIRYPAVYLGRNEYRDLLPDDKDQPYAFIILHDPAEYTPNSLTEPTTSQKFSLVIWGDIRKIYTDGTRHNELLLRQQVVSFLARGLGAIPGKVEITQSSTQAKNVFEGFDYQETKSQFLMHPWVGIRIDGILKTRQAC